jgi:hypothetical protein
MKTLVWMGCVVALTGSLSFADSTTPASAPAGKKMGPCKQIIAACESAGFEKGMHKKDGKGLYKDCLDPILAGTAVSGVTVDPATVTACQEAKAKHKAKKEAASAAPATAPAGQ